MSLTPGTRVGPYEITAVIGEGGMGKVWRAHHTALNRDDALKMLPDAFASDPDRLARFRREAQVLASLNHPNIAHVYGLEQADGIQALVMELAEGPTLSDRIAQGPVPFDEALPIAKQIAEALEAAHEQGIIHRDLKPANIKVRPDGMVKVLDFGLAKATEPVSVISLSHSQSPTITTPAMTQAGVILGTAAYMSPEQARGNPVDKRTDIWAFGCVLFEMLTGRRGFVGETTVEVLSNVLKAEPDWTALPAATPPAVRSLVRRCLQKDPTRRLRDIADARFQIEEVLNEPASGAAISTPVPVRKARERLLWVAGLLITVAVAVAGSAWSLRQPQVEADEVRLEVNVPPTTDPTSLAISPDGKTLVFVATSEGQPRLWLRSMDGVSARPLAGTENAKYPFWSPDGRSVGFGAVTQLKRLDLDSGSVRVLVSGGAAGPGAWNQDGTILFDRGIGGALFRVSAAGGEPTVLTLSDPLSVDPSFPQFLPDHRHFLFQASGDAPGIYIGQHGASDVPRRLLDAQGATYASGHLFFVRQGSLFAQPFDPVRLELAGSATAVAEQVVVSLESGAVALSASAAGSIVYRTGGSDAWSEFVWFDRSGKALETVPGSDIGTGFNSSISPDGHRLAISRRIGGTTDIWLLDLRRGVPSRFTFGPAFDLSPVWSPDSSRIAFTSIRNGKADVHVQPVGSDIEQLLLGDHGEQGPFDWSSDGRFLLYGARSRPTDHYHIWALPLGSNRKAFPVVESPSFDETDGQFSPDGKWIAFQSNESGRVEIFVQPFPGPGHKTVISSVGGMQVRWRQDGKELFYVAPDNRLLAVPIRFDATGQSVEVGTPVSLFAPQFGGTPQRNFARHYMVSRDGQRFLMDTLKEVNIPITVVLNWKPKS